MKSLIILVPFLIFCYCDFTSAESELDPIVSVNDWFEMTLDDLRLQCKLNSNLSIVEKTADEFLQLSNYVSPIETMIFKTSDYNPYNPYNPDMVAKLKELITSIQNCLFPNYQLNKIDEVKVLGRILNAHALKISQFDPPTVGDWYWMMINMRKIKACDKSFSPRSVSDNKTIYEWLMSQIGFNYSCEEIFPMEQCVMKAMETSNQNFKKIFKIFLSPPETEMCDNFREGLLSNYTEGK